MRLNLTLAYKTSYIAEPNEHCVWQQEELTHKSLTLLKGNLQERWGKTF